MNELSSLLEPFAVKLDGHWPLGEADRRAVLGLPHTVTTTKPGEYLFKAGRRTGHCCVILTGLACRSKVVAGGRRQILSVHMRGDGVDLQNGLLGRTDHDIQALTTLETASIPAESVSELVASHPGAARAMWMETLVDASIHREWTANVGARDAQTRLAHLLCELGLRMEAAGLSDRHRFDLVLTLEQLADATGLTAVHVNRTLSRLASDGLMTRVGSALEIGDWDLLASVGDFNPDYLHVTDRGPR